MSISTTSSTTIQGSWYLTLRLRIEGDLWSLGSDPTCLCFRGHWELIAVVLEELTGSENVGMVVLWAWANPVGLVRNSRICSRRLEWFIDFERLSKTASR